MHAMNTYVKQIEASVFKAFERGKTAHQLDKSNAYSVSRRTLYNLHKKWKKSKAA